MTAEAAKSEPIAPARLLIVLLGAIGDVLRALPLLGRLRRAWPEAHIAWAVEPKSRPIIQGHPWLDEIIEYDRRHAPWSFLRLLRQVRAGHFDLVIDLQRHLKSGVISMVSRAPVRIGFARENSKEFNYLFLTRTIEPQPNLRLKLMQYQAFADALGVAPMTVEFGLVPSADSVARARELLKPANRPIVGVILGSSWPSRVYFPESVAEVIRHLARPCDGGGALYPVLLGGSEEVSLATEVMRNLEGVEVMNLTGRTRLEDLAAIFKACAVAFGPDSGPMHIAAAVGCPVVSLWGATAAERSAPWGYSGLAIRAEIPCYGCYLRQCPIGRECMRRIAPAEVAAMARRACADAVSINAASPTVTAAAASSVSRQA